MVPALLKKPEDTELVEPVKVNAFVPISKRVKVALPLIESAFPDEIIIAPAAVTLAAALVMVKFR